MHTVETVRFQGEAFGSDSFIILSMATPYFMVQLPNTMGGSVCVPEKGRVRCIPTLQSSRTPPGGIWKLKHLPGFEWRSEPLLALPWSCSLASQRNKRCWRCGCSRKPLLIHSAHVRPLPENSYGRLSSQACLPSAMRQPFLWTAATREGVTFLFPSLLHTYGPAPPEHW